MAYISTYNGIPINTSSTTTAASNAPYWVSGFDTPFSVGCSNCPSQFTTGLGGEKAMSVSDAAVAAHANGWYIGGCNICVDCRLLVAPKEVDAQPDNN